MNAKTDQETGRQGHKDLIDQIDVLHLRGALVALNSLLSKLPSTNKLNKAGLRVCEKACDARNALRLLLAERDAGALTLKAFGGWEPVVFSPAASLQVAQSGEGVAA